MTNGFTTLQSLIWPEAHIAADHALYVRTDQSLHHNDGLRFDAGEVASFDTYFNLFNLGKWQHLCDLKTLHLELDGQGEFTLKIIFVGSNDTHKTLLERDISLTNVTLTRIEIPILIDSNDPGLLFFRITAHGPARLCTADWQTTQSALRQPVLALSITTFQREFAITNTVARFENHIKSSPYRGLMRLIVVDNGNSVKLNNSANTILIPSENLGGSGGFARGLIEARQTGASHCLFMDDDATVHMGSIERVYQMLAYVKSTKTAIAGTLADAADSGLVWENAALFDGTCKGLFRGTDLRDARQVVKMELDTTFALSKTKSQYLYGGWWFFAFALDQVQHLPFPFFVRGDDVSFSLVHDFDIVTLPGVLSFQDNNFSDKESPLTLYLDLRSHLAHQLSLPVMDRGRFAVAKIAIWFTLRALIRCHYDSAAALNMAFADVRRGPQFFADNADMAARRHDIKDLTQVEIWKPLKGPPPTDKIRFRRKNPLHRLLMILTINGLLIPWFSKFGNQITLTGENRKYLGSIWGAAQITHIDETAKNAYLVTHSKRRTLNELLKLLRNVTIFLLHYNRLKSDWQNEYNRLTKTNAFWFSKLKLNFDSSDKPTEGRS